MDINKLSSEIIGAAISVHQTLGPGLLESVYQKCMIIELKRMNLRVQSQIPLTISYRGHVVTQDDFRLDLVVEDTIIVELKSVEEVKPVHQKQLLTYLRLANKPLGLLLNFNVLLLKDGITRIIANEFLPDFPLKNQAKSSSAPLRSL
jgi:GxxExxY protein